MLGNSISYDYSFRSPKKAKRRHNSGTPHSVGPDRFIPIRDPFSVERNFKSVERSNSNESNISSDNKENDDAAIYTQLLRSQIWQEDDIMTSAVMTSGKVMQSPVKSSLLRFNASSPVKKKTEAKHLKCSGNDPLKTPQKFCSRSDSDDELEEKRSPVRMHTNRAASMLQSPGRANHRKVSKVPFRVLDAPHLVDDFYLNLLDWSQSNVVSVALGAAVYMWSGATAQVTKLCDLADEDTCTSVNWANDSKSLLAVGTNNGETQVWDVETCKRVRSMLGHKGRVGSISWNGPILTSGSRDHVMFHRDIRQQDHFCARLIGHRQEVCGLKWNPEGSSVASGGNDNKLLIWDSRSTVPILKFTDHTAAVKAIAWSPHQTGVLASGGGTADRHIRIWNTVNNTSIGATDAGSQVCNMHWSKNCNEIVSTHGYSLNQIIVWKCPTMSKVAVLPGHSSRVLYLGISPDGETLVTGAGDETLRFWNVFPSRSGSQKCGTKMAGKLGKANTIR
eukprot:Platyproteum_vivax@DN4501_c0_g1_i1.p1